MINFGFIQNIDDGFNVSEWSLFNATQHSAINNTVLVFCNNALIYELTVLFTRLSKNTEIGCKKCII